MSTLPEQARTNMNLRAREQTSTNPVLNPTPQGDEGTLINGVWYHYGTSANQTFIGHAG